MPLSDVAIALWPPVQKLVAPSEISYAFTVEPKEQAVIGTSHKRADSQAKLDGRLRYTADIRYEGLLYGLTVRAPLARGRLKAVKKGPGVDWSRIFFASAADIPGKKSVQMIADDMPFFATDEVRYKGEPVALVAAPSLAEAEAARQAVIVEMESLEPLLTLEEMVRLHRQGAAALEPLARWRLGHGEVGRALERAEVLLEGCYTTPHQEQAYLETNAMTAIPLAEGRMRLEGSMQCPYYVAPAVAAMLGTDLEHLEVLALPMGGAFGGKEDYPSLLGGHAALLAQLSGQPVRMALQRAEDVAYTTKRHPAWMRLRAGAQRDGTLVALEVEIVFDGGAYITMSPVVLSRGAIHAAGPYAWPAVSVDAVAYRSHTPPNGAFRGFGVPQTLFAIESHMDRLAQTLGLPPHELRLKNRLKPGDRTATSQVLGESVGSREVLAEALRATDFPGKWQRWGKTTGAVESRLARGVGMAFFWHGGGFTGSGEAKIAAKVALDLCADGKAHVRVSSTEMGQGAHTVLPQIAAEALGVTPEQAVCDPVNTAAVPNSGPTVASRTTMIVGAVLQSCARAARTRLLAAVAQARGLSPESLRLEGGAIYQDQTKLGGFAELLGAVLAAEGRERWVFEDQYRLPPQLKWDEVSHSGDAYAAYAWGCTVVELEVELDSYELRVPKITTVVDIGRAVNPILAQGQIEGGTLQALGYALCEEVGVRSDGGLLRDRFQTYILPTTVDAPEIEARIVEVPYSGGPGGAKGLGELPLHGVAPAVANALEHALGLRLTDLPLTPEKIYLALREVLR